jgi:citrate lyase subunit beta / citryl-CoA lyase
MMEKIRAVAGNTGPKVRSDCEVSIELISSGGLRIDLESKVRVLYGKSIIDLTEEVLRYFGIEHAVVSIRDSGALPFVISARIEAAAIQLVKTEKEFLDGFTGTDTGSTLRDRARYSRLYIPGNNPALMINAGLHSADGVILDLEDSVAPGRKDEARILVRNALSILDFNGAERMVRINQGEMGMRDLNALIPRNVNLVIIPKCETAEQVINVEHEIAAIRKKHNISGEVFLMPVIETALGVENAFSIALSCKSVSSIALGLEDYTADLGIQRTPEGKESFYARSRIVNCARAAGIQPIDSVFSDIGDMDALEKNVKESRSLGFEGMGCIHPRQIQTIRKGYMPSSEEIDKAKKIILAFGEAEKHGLGVIAVGSKMVDAPVVLRAQRTIRQAVAEKLLPADWMEEQKS